MKLGNHTLIYLATLTLACGQKNTEVSKSEGVMSKHLEIDTYEIDKDAVSVHPQNEILDGGVPDGELSLKGVEMLSRAIHQLFGPGRDLSLVETDANGRPLRLFEKFAANFGTGVGLESGGIYASGPSTGYFLALATLAENIASHLNEDVEANASSSAAYGCAAEDQARQMLQKAVPYRHFSAANLAEIVQSFQKSCAENYRLTIQALIASLAFAKR